LPPVKAASKNVIVRSATSFAFACAVAFPVKEIVADVVELVLIATVKPAGTSATV